MSCNGQALMGDVSSLPQEQETPEEDVFQVYYCIARHCARRAKRMSRTGECLCLCDSFAAPQACVTLRH